MSKTSGRTVMMPEAPAQKAPFPFLDLQAQFEPMREEIREAVLRILESQRFILGPEVERLEAAVARYVGCRFAVGCASGTDALLLALMALGIGPGDEVVTTPFTFIATASCIARLGAKPVFADIDPATYNLDPAAAAKLISKNTRAIIPVHLYGLSADMPALLALGEQHGVGLIEDAAQALGAECDGIKAGNFGVIGCLSFFPSKNLGGAGDGGLLTSNDPDLAERLRVLRVHGSRKKYRCEILGINSRLDALQAAILNAKLPHLETWTEKRRGNAERYLSLFREFGLEGRITLPLESRGMRHVYNQFVVRLRARDDLRQFLQRRAIPTEIYYPEPLHLQPAFAYLGYKSGDFPNAEAASREVLALPIYPELTEQQQAMVVSTIAEFYASH